MRVSIQHPTDRPNFTIVRVGSLALAFSYTTVVGYAHGWSGWVLPENVWSSTTGRHLNWLDDDHSKRLPYSEWEARLNDVLDDNEATVS